LGADGRLQYAPLPQAPASVPVAPAPSAPMAQPSPLVYPSVSAPVLNAEALAAQRSLDCWAKWVRVVSALLLAAAVVLHLVWALSLANNARRQPLPADLIVWRVVTFILVCLVCKLGIRAGSKKTVATARCFLKAVVVFGVVGLAAVGIRLFKSPRGGRRKTGGGTKG
jgi:hypothetical protein